MPSLRAATPKGAYPPCPVTTRRDTVGEKTPTITKSRGHQTAHTKISRPNGFTHKVFVHTGWSEMKEAASSTSNTIYASLSQPHPAIRAGQRSAPLNETARGSNLGRGNGLTHGASENVVENSSSSSSSRDVLSVAAVVVAG